MGAGGNSQAREGGSQRSWAGVGWAGKAFLALLLAKFVVATGRRCSIRLEPVVQEGALPVGKTQDDRVNHIPSGAEEERRSIAADAVRHRTGLLARTQTRAERSPMRINPRE